MVQPSRKYQAGSASYRYSINGQEKEKELNENITSAEYWEYDSRIIRRWNVDPIYKSNQSNYACFNNNPIYYIDANGLVGEPNKATGVIKATFIFVRAKGMTDKQYNDYKANFQKNVSNYYNGSRTFNNGKKDVPITGDFTFSENTNLSVDDVNKMSKSGQIATGTNYIVIGGTQGRSYVNDKRDVAYMNVNMGGNTNTDVHETGHLFGLADRYNYVQQVKGDNITPTSKTVNMLLPKSEDAEYYNHEDANLMSGGGNVTTQKQWNYIFNGVVEKTNQVTYLLSGQSYFGQGAFGVQKDGRTIMERIDGKDVYHNIDKTTNNYMNPITKSQSKGAADWFFGEGMSKAKMKTNSTNLKNPYEGGN